MELAKTNILGWVYCWDRRDYVGHSGRRRVIFILRNVGMYVCDGGGVNTALEKKTIGSRIMLFQPTLTMRNRRNVMGYVSKKKKH